jgi:hypothetical protein
MQRGGLLRCPVASYAEGTSRQRPAYLVFQAWNATPSTAFLRHTP